MAHPPRIPVLLADDRPVVYFLTLCVDKRKPVLANASGWAAMGDAIARLDRWDTLAALAMPDHVHILAAPRHRHGSPGEYSRWFKRWVRETLSADWRWQSGVFDRLLRDNESAAQKWVYVRENPVAAGLVRRWQDWPYRMGFEDF